MRVYEIPKSRLIGKPVGVVKGCSNGVKYKNVVNAFIDGDIPILIETDMTQEEFDRFTDATLTKEDTESLKARGIF